MNISKFVDFTLIKGHSRKTDKDYYAICIKLDDKEFPIAFISSQTYELLSSKLK